MEFKSQKRKNKKPNFDEFQSNKWLDDDNQYGDIHRSSSSASSQNKKNESIHQSDDKPIEVNFKLSVPSGVVDYLKNFKSKITKRSAIFAGVAFVLVVGSSVLWLNNSSPNSNQALGDSTDIQGQGNIDLPRENPEFDILYPGGKDADSVGEIVRISPDGTDPVYTYIDRIGAIQINVSQQLLPERFRSNTEHEIEKLAKSFQQNEILIVDGVTVHYGNSERGVQSLLFVKGNLLITIRSAQVITDDAWAAYISALHS